MSSPDLTLHVGESVLPSAVLNASGCAGRGPELARLDDLSGFGAFVTPSVSLSGPRERGAPEQVTSPAASGWLVDPALAHVSVHDVLASDLPWLHARRARVVASVAGSSVNEYVQVVTALRTSPAFDAVVAVELNLAMPNHANAGVPLCDDPLSAGKVVALVRERLPRGVPVLAKLPGDRDGLLGAAGTCVRAGAAGLVVTHPVRAVEVDAAGLGVHDRFAQVGAGLVGPAIRPVALRAVRTLRQAMDAGRVRSVPIIGVGGVRTGGDALAMLAVGATGVQVGSALLTDPRAVSRVSVQLRMLMSDKGIGRTTDVYEHAYQA